MKILELAGTIDFDPDYDYKAARRPMRIIVDTSVWSHFLRRDLPSQNPQRQKLESLIEQEQPLLLLGVVCRKSCRESAIRRSLLG